MEEYEYVVRIPKARVGVLIGEKGNVKKHLEGLTKCELDIDSDEGTVTITGNDTLQIFQLQDVVKAIGRGFNPELGQLLLKQDYMLEIININDFVKNRKNQMLRVKGRVIGRDGKAREMIESITETYISVYGKTVSIIGTVERVQIARHAIEKLLGGAPHGPVYKMLQNSISNVKKKELLS